jgi:CheY-like chemotaxis protein
MLPQDTADHLNPQQVRLQLIQSTAKHARELVQQILGFSRKQPRQARRQALKPLVLDLLPMLRASLPAGVQLDVLLPDEEPIPGAEVPGRAPPLLAVTDRTEFEQVLINLCRNAWQALDKPQGHITVGLGRLPPGHDLIHRAQLDAQAAHAHLWVRDDGVGMDPLTRDRVFEPFFTTKPMGQGTGLGLAMVHGIVRSQHGGLVLDSEPGLGSTFHVLWPTMTAADPTTPKPPTAPVANTAVQTGPHATEAHAPAGTDVQTDVGTHAASTTGYRPGDEVAPGSRQRTVLVIDDDEVVGLTVEALLTRAGFGVVRHSSPRSALAALADLRLAVDLVLTDYAMPDLTGLDIAEAARDLRPATPVVLLSGYFVDGLEARATGLGVRGLVHKERAFEDLVSTLQRVLQEPPHAASVAHAAQVQSTSS